MIEGVYKKVIPSALVKRTDVLTAVGLDTGKYFAKRNFEIT